MPPIHTNRDLYLFIADLTERHRGHTPPLETYLRALRARFQQLRDREALDPSTFAGVLAAAFDGEPPPGDLPATASGFAQVSDLLDQQIDDLQAMKARGTLDDPQRYFGVDAPSGQRWYNFDPLTYIECGMQGSFGGYQEGDDTGRELVPGEVAVLNEEGNIEAVDPHELDPGVSELGDIPWDDVERFLGCGQMYE